MANANSTISLLFAVGSALAGIAAVYENSRFSPTMGRHAGTKAFVAAVLGGIGPPGAVIGGLIVGLPRSLLPLACLSGRMRSLHS